MPSLTSSRLSNLGSHRSGERPEAANGNLSQVDSAWALTTVGVGFEAVLHAHTAPLLSANDARWRGHVRVRQVRADDDGGATRREVGDVVLHDFCDFIVPSAADLIDDGVPGARFGCRVAHPVRLLKHTALSTVAKHVLEERPGHGDDAFGVWFRDDDAVTSTNGCAAD